MKKASKTLAKLIIEQEGHLRPDLIKLTLQDVLNFEPIETLMKLLASRANEKLGNEQYQK